MSFFANFKMTLNLFSLIPDHVFLNITRYLRADEVMNLKTVVDKTWIQYAFDNMRHFEMLVEKEDHDFEYYRNQLLRCGSDLRTFKFIKPYDKESLPYVMMKYIDGDISHRIADDKDEQEFAVKLAKQCPNIISFGQNMWDYERLHFVCNYILALEQSPKLTELSVGDGIESIKYAIKINEIANLCPNIVSMKILYGSTCSLGVHFTHFDRIKQLRLYNDLGPFAMISPTTYIRKCLNLAKLEFNFIFLGDLLDRCSNYYIQRDVEWLVHTLHDLSKLSEILISVKNDQIMDWIEAAFDAKRFKMVRRTSVYCEWQRI